MVALLLWQLGPPGCRHGSVALLQFYQKMVQLSNFLEQCLQQFKTKRGQARLE